MISSTVRHRALFHSPLDQQAALLVDPTLDAIDALLDDQELVQLVRDRLGSRRPGSARTGRRSIAPDRLLRCCVLKHMRGWSFRESERELRANLVYRRFTRFDADPTPDHVTLSRNFALLGDKVMAAIHQRVVGQAQEARVAPGKKLRVDTTVVESNIHHPTDSSLLADGVRVLTRALQGIAQQCQPGAVTVINHARSVKHRLIELTRATKTKAAGGRKQLESSYRKLVATTRAVVKQAKDVLAELHAGSLAVAADAGAKLIARVERVQHYLPLVERAIDQTVERVFAGNRHVVGKVLSLFEPHTQVICKGKAHKPAEFGRLVRIDEVERGIVSALTVLEGNPADTTSWVPALKQHKAQFGHAPRMATGDRGFHSARNETAAKRMGVKRVVLPARGRLSKRRRRLERSRWFRRGRRWRANIEARIATLKHRFEMARATYKGEKGFTRYVGWCVIAHNLVSFGRAMLRRRGA
jgi:IS5 family transposase